MEPAFAIAMRHYCGRFSGCGFIWCRRQFIFENVVDISYVVTLEYIRLLYNPFRYCFESKVSRHFTAETSRRVRFHRGHFLPRTHFDAGTSCRDELIFLTEKVYWEKGSRTNVLIKVKTYKTFMFPTRTKGLRLPDPPSAASSVYPCVASTIGQTNGKYFR